MNRRNVYWVMAVLFVVAGAPVLGQQKLGDLVAEGGYEWMIGDWVATTDNGEIYTSFKWELNKHAIFSSFKMGEYESKSMILYVASEEKIVQYGVDNRGGHSKGVWEENGTQAICKSEGTGADGQKIKLGVTYEQVDANTMKVQVFGIEDSGELAEDPWFTVEYKRKKPSVEKQ